MILKQRISTLSPVAAGKSSGHACLMDIVAKHFWLGLAKCYGLQLMEDKCSLNVRLVGDC